VAAVVLVLAVVLAGCDNGGSSGAKKKPRTTSGSNTASSITDPSLAAVGQWVRSQGHDFAGECSDVVLPRDKGKWCATLVNGAGGPGVKVYDVGPVGGSPQKRITVSAHTDANLHPGGQVPVDSGTVGTPQQLSRDQLAQNQFIVSNLQLDQLAGVGNGLADLNPIAPTPTTTTTPATTTAPPGGGGGAGGGTVDVGPQPYGNSGGIVVGTPTVNVGGEIVFKGSGCKPNETLIVTFDGKPVGTLPADANGNFSGSITLPVGTTAGVHTVHVTGTTCDLVFTVTVSGLAFTGASSHTSTYVLAGATAVVVGSVLIVGSRRRRTIRGRRRRV
jgi:hypothetical protein